MSERVLRLALPAGSLQEATLALFQKAGYSVSLASRSYSAALDDPELACTLIRVQEMAHYVQDGLVDGGLMGHDWVVETGADVVEVAELTYGKHSSRRVLRYVLAVPEASPIREVADLEGKRVATEVVNLTKQFFDGHGVKANVEFSWGATEAKAPELADAIVDITETGSSLRANKLREVATVFETTTRFIAGHAAWADRWKRRKIEDIVLMLKGAMAAEGKVGLMMNVHVARLTDVISQLPALKQPTVSSLSEQNWVAINTIVDESVVREIIPKLKQAGAQGIVEYPLNKIIE